MLIGSESLIVGFLMKGTPLRRSLNYLVWFSREDKSKGLEVLAKCMLHMG